MKTCFLKKEDPRESVCCREYLGSRLLNEVSTGIIAEKDKKGLLWA